MPTASKNVKTGKHASANGNGASPPDSGSGSESPLQQIITLMEHKIRNLDKRKSKLESYRELQNAGKELNADQKVAVAKYDEVRHTFEFANDICKQFQTILISAERDAKRQAKREAAAKYQAELAKLREILLVQDALNQMGNETVREDFLNGRNGAAQLVEADLKLLDDLYPAVTPKHEAGNPTAFTNEVQAAAEHLLAVVDGKPNEIFGGSYCQIKEVLGKIHESGYFDQVQVYETANETTVNNDVSPQIDTLPVEDVNQQQPPQEPIQLSIPSQSIQPQPVVAAAAAAAAATTTTVVVVDPNLMPEQQIFYQQQQPRPITEMLGAGSFYFLQESEIDTPPEQISTQTFTNQSFVGGPPQQKQPPAITIFQQLPTQQPPQKQQQQPAIISGNNNIDERDENRNNVHNIKTNDNHNNHHNRQRPINNHSYYQNNNGYSPRPNRQNRNSGSRSGNRHN